MVGFANPVVLGARPARGGITPLAFEVPPVPPFSPLDITGLVAWYDFSDAATLFTDTARTTAVTADAQTIGGVTDKSGAGNHLSQAISGDRPVYKVAIKNGLSVARFVDGATETMASGAPAATATDNWSLIAVWKSVNFGAQNSPLSNGSNNGYSLISNVGAGPYQSVLYGGVAGNAADGSPTAVDTWYIQGAVRTSGTLTNYQNGVVLTPTYAGAPSAPTTAVILGDAGSATRYFYGDFAEGFIVDSALSTINHNLLGDYLGAKWGLTWTTVA